jgi:hypothetical protein
MPMPRSVLRTSTVRLATLLAALLVGARAAAQGRDTTVAAVQRMVNAGDRVGARQYADSVLRTVREGSGAYAEALYARAFASSSAVEAERDYLRVAVEYALSPRAEEATMMVAQLKLARSDRTGARRNFERLVREHPMGAQVAKAAFWAGRLAVEDGDLVRGCQSLGVARERSRSDDVEFANQVEYYLQRCTPAALAAANAQPAATAAATPPATPPVTPPATEPPPAATRDRATTARPGTRPAPRPSPGTPPRGVARDTAAPATPPGTPPSTPAATPPRDTSVRDTTPPVRTPLPPNAPTADSTPSKEPPATKPAAPLKEYSVQVAAFPKQRDADALAQVLSQRGFSARVWGSAAPFRVRVGRYATREEAVAQLARMKAARLNGIVVDAEPQ